MEIIPSKKMEDMKSPATPNCAELSTPNTHINVTLQDGQDHEFSYRIKQDTLLKGLMLDFAKRLGVNHETLRFLLDERLIKATNTARDMEIEDGAIICVMAEQFGAGGAM